jgi:hypothetical protein
VATLKKAKETDVFVLEVQEISKLSAEEAIAEVSALLDAADQNYFRIGGTLSAISAQKFYKTVGFENFNEFVETIYGMKRRKAQYWMKIYDDLIESSVPWAKVKDVGWTKLRGLAGILTLENVDEWVERALSSTVLQLRESIAKAKASSLPNNSGITPTDDEKSNVTAFTVKVHDDQKTLIKEAIAKARAEANTDYYGVALEGICMNYLSGGNVTKTSLTAILAQYTPEEVLSALEPVFPEFEITAKLKNAHHVCG